MPKGVIEGYRKQKAPAKAEAHFTTTLKDED
jgi:hypothetical protein